MKAGISTELSEGNISLVLKALSEIPLKLAAISQPFSENQLKLALEEGKRSFFEELSHLVNCEARTSEAIYLALLIKEPYLLSVHPERQWGKLISYEDSSFRDLLSYFKFRRNILLSVLQPLSGQAWSKVVHEKNKKRKESVYWKARALAVHEMQHLEVIKVRLSHLS